MLKTYFLIFTLFSIAILNVGGCNIYSDMSDKNSDAAIIADVNKLIDASLWNDAILKWQSLSPAGQGVRSNRVLLATAYAGRGKLDLLGLVDSLVTNPVSVPAPTTIFRQLLTIFKGADIGDFSDQTAAEALLLGISATAAGRTTDENTFLLFVEFAKLGTLFAATGDLDVDGIVDATYDNCALSSNEGAHVVTAVGNIVDILGQIGTTLVGSNLNGLLAACASLGGACGVTDTANVTALMNQAGRTLVGESNLLVGLKAPYNDPYCQLTNSPIDPVAAGVLCPGGTGASIVCP